MKRLADNLPLPEQRKQVVQDCCRLLDAEVARKEGMSALAIKGAYGLLKRIKPTAVPEAIDGLLDDMLQELEPFYQNCGGKKPFGGYLKENAAAVAEALLKVTDRRAEKSRHATLASAYRKLRPGALRHVQEAVPALADLIERYLVRK